MPSKKIEGLFDSFPVGQLKVDPKIQGRLSLKWAAKIAATWNDDAYGVLEVSHRDGSYYVTNGQHRLCAARMLGIETLRVHIVESPSQSEEATVWVIQNLGVKAKNTEDRYRMLVTEGEPVACSVRDICAECGVEVSFHGDGRNRTKAVGALMTITSVAGAHVAREALTACREAWDGAAGSLNNYVIRGAARFVQVYRSHRAYSHVHLVDALSRKTVAEVMRNLRSASSGGSINGSADTLPYLIRVYNSGLRSNRLPDASRADMKRLSLGQNPWTDAS